MKAWDDLINDADKTICSTMNSLYYINHGCKIEKFNEDGRYEIKNTMTNSDHYEDVPGYIYTIFEMYGFDAGAFSMCSNVYSRRAENTKYLIGRALYDNKTEVASRLEETYQKLINKCEDYDRRLKNILPSL